VLDVVVEQRRRIVERHAVELAVDHGVGVQRRPEILEVVVARRLVGLEHRLERNDVAGELQVDD
jgi:hypothetical protein